MEEEENLPPPMPMKHIHLSFSQQSTYQVKEDGGIQKNTHKKRITLEKWAFAFDPVYYSSEKQLELLTSISLPFSPEEDPRKDNTDTLVQQIQKKMVQEIKHKLYGYKQQDIHKKIWNPEHFITLANILERLIACNLKCYYCEKDIHVLYDIQRQSSQWSVDRIDNDVGHNVNNYYIACLECNLKRRRRSDSKFLSTKQMVLIKR